MAAAFSRNRSEWVAGVRVGFSWFCVCGFGGFFVVFGFGVCLVFYSRKDGRCGPLGKKYELAVGFLD